MKLDYRNEVKAIGVTAFILVGLVLFAYSMFWIIAYGWAMIGGGVNKWFVYIFAIAIVLIIHRIVRKKVYNPDGD